MKEPPPLPVWDRYSDFGTFEQYHNGEFIIYEIARGYFTMIMFDLVGDEYQLVGEYVNMFTEVELKHVLCGKSIFIKPFDFINGKRCLNCKVRHTGEEIAEFLNEVISDFRFISNYDHTMDDYLFRVMELEYSNKVARIKKVYQFTEDTLVQELLRQKNHDSIFTRIFIGNGMLYGFFFQKNINCISQGKENGDE